jgi:hypothetical protein
MSNSNSKAALYVELDDGPLAHVWQIVDLDTSYRLACAAMKIGARATGGREDYAVEPFSKTSPLHKRLHGASDATETDYVFLSAMPLEALKRFMEELHAPAGRSMAA